MYQAKSYSVLNTLFLGSILLSSCGYKQGELSKKIDTPTQTSITTSEENNLFLDNPNHIVSTRTASDGSKVEFIFFDENNDSISMEFDKFPSGAESALIRYKSTLGLPVDVKFTTCCNKIIDARVVSIGPGLAKLDGISLGNPKHSLQVYFSNSFVEFKSS